MLDTTNTARKTRAVVQEEEKRIIAMRLEKKTWIEIQVALNLTSTQLNNHIAKITKTGRMPGNFEVSFFVDPVEAFPKAYHEYFRLLGPEETKLIRGELWTKDDLKSNLDSLPDSFVLLTHIELMVWLNENNTGDGDTTIIDD